MNNVEQSLWARAPEARIPMSRAVDLLDAADRASGKSPRPYCHCLGSVFAHLENELGREPTLADLTPQPFRLFLIACRVGPGRNTCGIRSKRPRQTHYRRHTCTGSIARSVGSLRGCIAKGFCP